ncbi:putative receptor-like protein kinase [Salvia divinorum]|uniref:non-specific serine/threonine protein kinase n=1 Tax=Salvia divinorum TaxID=28513 RepID=A0ABD1FU14_SALDI
MASDLNAELSKNVGGLGIKVREFIGIIVGLLIVVILFVLIYYLASQKKLRRAQERLPLSQIPTVSKEIKEVRVEQVSTEEFAPHDGILLTIYDKSSDKEPDRVLVHLGMPKAKNADNSSQSGSFRHIDKRYLRITIRRGREFGNICVVQTILVASNNCSFSFKWPARVFALGGQAEKEFGVEVEAIGHVRHKNLVRLLGYCIEGTHRMLVYEYVNNANLE